MWNGMETFPEMPPSLQIPEHEDLAAGNVDFHNHGPGDPYSAMHMPGATHVEHMSQGYFANYCYPAYPPPPPAFAAYGPVYMGVAQPMYMPMMGVPMPYFVPPPELSPYPEQYELKPDQDSISRESRRTRIARRREQSYNNERHEPGPAEAAAVFPAHGPSDGALRTPKHEHSTHPAENPPPIIAASTGQGVQGRDMKDLMFLFTKQLSPSGVSSLGRIVLPKKEAEAHLPPLFSSEGLLLPMTDFDTHETWIFRYRFWLNNRSRMYLLENTRDFVKTHGIQERDLMVLYKHAEGHYVVRVVKVFTDLACDQTLSGINAAEDVPTTEEEISRKNQTFEFLV